VSAFDDLVEEAERVSKTAPTTRPTSTSSTAESTPDAGSARVERNAERHLGDSPISVAPHERHVGRGPRLTQERDSRGHWSDGRTPLIALSHLDLSVSDRHESAMWYAGVLEFETQGDRFNEVAQLPWIHLAHPCRLSVGLGQHPDSPGEPFDERHPGLDHVSSPSGHGCPWPCESPRAWPVKVPVCVT
jgi:hypothetical protein